VKFIDGNFLPTDDKAILLYGKTGNLLENEDKHKLQHYAKLIQSYKDDQVKETYYIRIYQSVPFDPMGPYGRRERNLDTEMKRVSRNTFDYYVTYLKTNNSIFLTKAQRGFLND
jgi:hypothetical protein